MTQVRAVTLGETGGPEVLRYGSSDVPSPGAGEALVRHEAVGVNFIDTYHRSGLYPLELPSGIGIEAAGVVEQVGANVPDLEVGQRVAYAGGPPGAYAGARVIEAAQLIPLPDDVDARSAAAVTLKGLTVEYLIRRTFPVSAGTTVLWHAAAGGVGLIACQWLRHLGAEVIGTVGSEEKARLASANGCTHVINYREEDFVRRVDELTGGRGVPVVYDSVGRDTIAGSMKSLSPRGYLVAFGNASGPPPAIDPLELGKGGSLFLTRPRLPDYVADRGDLLEAARDLFALVASGEIRPRVGQEWPLPEAAEAHRSLEGRSTTGSSLLIPEEEG